MTPTFVNICGYQLKTNYTPVPSAATLLFPGSPMTELSEVVLSAMSAGLLITNG